MIAASFTMLQISAPVYPISLCPHSAPTRGHLRQLLRHLVHVAVDHHLAQVDLRDRLSPAEVRLVHRDVAIEAPGAQQRGVQHVHAVGAREHGDAVARLEAVHLDEDLVQRLLALVVGARKLLPLTYHNNTHALTALLADGVDLIDEHDARRVLARLREQLAHALRAHAHEQLHEVAARHADERHVRLARRRLHQQRLARARRTREDGALHVTATMRRHLGELGAELGVLVAVLQEVDKLHDLRLRLVDARHVLERHARVLHDLDRLVAHAHRLVHEAVHAALLRRDQQRREDHQHQHRRQHAHRVRTDRLPAKIINYPAKHPEQSP